jgi:hypothetical protein
MANLDEKRTLQGKFYKAANGHETYEIFYAVPDILFEISEILVSKFRCTQPDLPIVGLDQVLTQCRKGNIELALGWDNWSGFYMLANSSQSDILVREIGAYLDTIIGGKDFEKYIHYW